MNRESGEFEVRGERLLPFLVLAALILFHIVNNWVWLSTNVTRMGWDRILAERDSEPVGGSRPTGGRGINYGIILPKGLPTGEYQLQAGMYDATSGERMPFYGRDGK